jgi:hypothetical protein
VVSIAGLLPAPRSGGGFDLPFAYNAAVLLAFLCWRGQCGVLNENRCSTCIGWLR